jgi:hypothetical protein
MLYRYIFNLQLEYASRKAHENQVGLKFNGTHQLDIYLFGDKCHKENTEVLIDARKEICLEVITEKKNGLYVEASSPDCWAKP